MSGTLKITQNVSFSYLDQNWTKVQDDYEGAFKPQIPGQNHPSGMGHVHTGDQQAQAGQQQGLLIQIAATHSGIITRNNGFYLPDRMRKGTQSFTKDYPKPVLLHHEDHKDPVGRIVEAQYIDTSDAIQDKYHGMEVKNKSGEVVGTINEQLIKDFTGSKMPFGQQIDVVRTLLRDTMLEDMGYQGLGYIRIQASITDPDAVQKLLDGRYITGSVGATTNKAICSVCRTDWTDSGPCDHKPGAVYDEAKCFIIAGDLIYDEYSFVNVPADRHSGVLQLDYNGRSESIEVVNDYKGRLYEVQLGFPQYESTKEETGMAKDANKSVSTKGADSTVDIKDATDTSSKKEGEQVADSTSDKTDDTQVSDDTQGEKSVQDDDTSKEESIEDFVVRVLDATEKVELTAEEATKLYDFMWSYAEKAVKDGALTLTEEQLAEAKLSDEKRGKLPKSSFCDSTLTLPVTNAAHVIAARQLVDSLKLSDETKKTMLKVINRKAKVLDCSSIKTQDAAKTGDTKDGMEHSRTLRMVLSLLDEDTYYTDKPVLDDDEKKMLQSIIKRMATMVGKDSFQGALFAEGVAQNETALVDEVASLEETVGELRDRLDGSLKEHNILFQEYEELHDSLVTEKSETRKAKESQLGLLVALRDEKVAESSDLTELSSDDLDSEINRTLEVVDMVKITDKLGDGMSRTPADIDLDDPIGIQDGSNKKSKVADVAELERIQERYMLLRFTNQVAADTYLADMRRRGKFPIDVEQIQGGSN